MMTKTLEVAGTEDVVSVRCFLAIALDPALQTALEGEVERLRQAGAKVSWVPPERMHLTLIFLGEIAAARLETAAGIMDRVAKTVPAFQVRVEGIGSFGSPARPRVIWAGIPAAPQALFALHQGLNDGLSQRGFEVERKAYTPHLTLGRVRGPVRLTELTSALTSDKNTCFGTLTVARVELMQSYTDPRGGRYSTVHESVLEGV